jgi:hypothetical protein
MSVLSGITSQAVIDTAVAQRERLRSGRSRTDGVTMLLVPVGLGLYFALVVGWQMVGWVLVGLCVLLIIPMAVKLDPAKPWGRPLDAVCPRCRQRNLRERRTKYSVTRGRITRTYTGIVTLCTADCGYRAVRQP